LRSLHKTIISLKSKSHVFKITGNIPLLLEKSDCLAQKYNYQATNDIKRTIYGSYEQMLHMKYNNLRWANVTGQIRSRGV